MAFPTVPIPVAALQEPSITNPTVRLDPDPTQGKFAPKADRFVGSLSRAADGTPWLVGQLWKNGKPTDAVFNAPVGSTE